MHLASRVSVLCTLMSEWDPVSQSGGSHHDKCVQHGPLHLAPYSVWIPSIPWIWYLPVSPEASGPLDAYREHGGLPSSEMRCTLLQHSTLRIGNTTGTVSFEIKFLCVLGWQFLIRPLSPATLLGYAASLTDIAGFQKSLHVGPNAPCIVCKDLVGVEGLKFTLL